MGKHFDIESVKKSLLTLATGTWARYQQDVLCTLLQHVDEDDRGTYLYKECVGFGSAMITRYQLGYHQPGTRWTSTNIHLNQTQYETLSTLCKEHQLLKGREKLTVA